MGIHDERKGSAEEVATEPNNVKTPIIEHSGEGGMPEASNKGDEMWIQGKDDEAKKDSANGTLEPCGCSWTSKSSCRKGKDDGSRCWKECCEASNEDTKMLGKIEATETAQEEAQDIERQKKEAEEEEKLKEKYEEDMKN